MGYTFLYSVLMLWYMGPDLGEAAPPRASYFLGQQRTPQSMHF